MRHFSHHICIISIVNITIYKCNIASRNGSALSGFGSLVAKTSILVYTCKVIPKLNKITCKY